VLESLRQEIISWYSDSEDLDRGGLNNHLCTNGFAGLVEQLTARGPSTVWYSDSGLDKTDVLDAWRARWLQYRRLENQRASRHALADAIVCARDDEAKVQGLTIDRLFNDPNAKKQKGGR
jgi:hypothetical protein